MKQLFLSIFALLLCATSFGQAGVISGPSAICIGNTATMTDTVPGGVWTVSSTALATISSGGLVTGITSGVVTISYAVGASLATHVLTLNPSPLPSSGPSTACVGVPVTFTCSTIGGTWSVSAPMVATIDPVTGVLTGISSGVDIVSYALGTGCSSISIVTVNAASASPISTTATAICIGSSTTLTDATPGGTWASSDPAVASVDVTGLVTGNSAGTAIITYSVTTACGSGTPTLSMTVNPLPTLSGPTSVCVGGTITPVGSPTGGMWSSSVPTVVSVGFMGGVTGVSAGTAMITYTLTTGCSATENITVTASTLTITPGIAYGVCNGGVDTLTATSTGATSFSWSPSTGLSCPTCAVTTLTTGDTTTFTVVASDATGCTATGTLTIDGNRIKGHILYGSGTPAVPDTKVWLIQYNPIDSSLTALDSMVTCMDGATPYYQFNDKVAGSYLVKAKLESSVPGTSDYIPTYGLSNPHWDTATTITHASGANTQDINMIYGTVPAGPGFIGGLIVMGAGKGTSGEVAAPNILVYLEDGAGHVLTYTYSDATGAYSFSGLGYGNYIIYPTDYKYRTTPSALITLSASSSSVTAVDFKKHTTLGTITPFTIATGVNQLPGDAQITLSPNPAGSALQIVWKGLEAGTAQLCMTDMMGRTVSTRTIDVTNGSGSYTLQTELPDGSYFVRISGAHVNWTGRIEIVK